MSRAKKVLLAALAAATCLSLSAAIACTNGQTQTDADIINGGFETQSDEWVGWTNSGTAFSARGVVTDDAVNDVTVDKTGERWFSGLSGGTSSFTGTLQSNTFTLSGTGIIAFKMGAAADGEKIYVEFCDADGTVLEKVTNTDFDGQFITDQLIRKMVDLSDHIGEDIYIKVTDNDTSRDYEYGYVNLDDFVMCATQDDVEEYEAERTAQLEEYAAPSFEEDETESTVRNGSFEDGLNNWLILEGSAFGKANVVPTSQLYWGEFKSYGEGDYYFDGVNNGSVAESGTGSMRSTKFTLGGDGYITFMIGAAKNRSTYVAICDGETGDELIKFTNDTFNDPNLPNTLRRVYVDASEYIGKVLYIKVVDNATQDFGFINVDDFRCSLTEEEVLALEIEQYNAINNMPEADRDGKWSYLKSYYDDYEYPVAMPIVRIDAYVTNKVVAPSDSVNVTAFLDEAQASYGEEAIDGFEIIEIKHGETTITEGFDSVDMSQGGAYYVTYAVTYATSTQQATFTVLAQDTTNQVANGGFETGDMTGWTILTEGWAMTEGKPAGVIGDSTWWAERLPYNQSGSYHLDGWNTGIAEGDTWAVRSTTFTLSGSGWMTLKMGGNAAVVKVYTADGTQIGEYKQTQFTDAGFPNVSVGHWADMHTYAIDLHEYVGQQLYIELCDVAVSGWAHAFFDEVITYYETAPDVANSYDTVNNALGQTPETVQFPWILATNILGA